eukprot:CAMPEP_0172495426 /NCGR_PEP_ID=MMETSP1066-20121228/70433_1 /TAXON_ID=671091 /ORGANISM="Coscinodiscus wailesii, Strain CCMP2513" /LENGTH=63 /DNA_ID=CAMNT_0013267089 /DNA_START=212 /DNA_END=400 /DNA_ORIENTATION=-
MQCHVLLRKVPTLIAFVTTRGIIPFWSVLTGDFIRKVPAFTVFVPARGIITFIIDAAGARRFL